MFIFLNFVMKYLNIFVSLTFLINFSDTTNDSSDSYPIYNSELMKIKQSERLLISDFKDNESYVLKEILTKFKKASFVRGNLSLSLLQKRKVKFQDDNRRLLNSGNIRYNNSKYQKLFLAILPEYFSLMDIDTLQKICESVRKAPIIFTSKKSRKSFEQLKTVSDSIEDLIPDAMVFKVDIPSFGLVESLSCKFGKSAIHLLRRMFLDNYILLKKLTNRKPEYECLGSVTKLLDTTHTEDVNVDKLFEIIEKMKISDNTSYIFKNRPSPKHDLAAIEVCMLIFSEFQKNIFGMNKKMRLKLSNTEVTFRSVNENEKSEIIFWEKPNFVISCLRSSCQRTTSLKVVKCTFPGDSEQGNEELKVQHYFTFYPRNEEVGLLVLIPDDNNKEVKSINIMLPSTFYLELLMI